MNIDHPDPELNSPLTDKELHFLERFLSGNAVCDDAALAEARDAISTHGIASVTGDGPAPVSKH